MTRSSEYTVPLRSGHSPAVITVTGVDRPGVTASFFRVLAAHDVQVLDVEQSQFRGFLSLAAFVGIDPKDQQRLTQGLNDTLHTTTMKVTLELANAPLRGREASTHVLVVLGNPVNAQAVSAIGQTLADYGANIDTIKGIADYPVTGLELAITVPNREPGGGVPLRKALAEVSNREQVDIAIERNDLRRRSKRLICFDCDSTLITGEVIEMLAAHAGREAEVAAVTERAMRGELDFEESLRERVAALAGLDASVIEEVARQIRLTPGAKTTVRTLKRMGFRTAVVSGGFIQVLEPLARELALDYVRANTLEIVDGKLTGKVVGPVVDRAAKAAMLADFAADAGLAMHQTVAVGDGANDIDMISAAGLGIAFNAKPALKDVADASVSTPFLDEVLHMLGITRAEVDASDSASVGNQRRPLEDEVANGRASLRTPRG